VAKKEERSKKTSKVKPTKTEVSAGGAVFKKQDGSTRWLIIKPADKDRWQLPKGLIEEGEKAEDAAFREVKEEGGVETNLILKIKDIRYFYFFEGQRIFKIVTYFLMEFKENTEEGHDKEVDEAKFLEFEKAHKLLTFKNDKDVLKEAKSILNRGIQKNLI
jgi:ADP-ribose pyrophosphatase YjhB (NUDIX family)